MTTIAVNAHTGEMAYDDGWSDEDVRGAMKKVFRIDGDLYGFAGTVGMMRKFREWVKDGMAEGESPKLRGEDNVIIMVLRGKKVYTWTETDGLCEEENKLFAIGTGACAARGAFLAGASIRKAVDIACQIDAQSSGRTRVMKLNMKPKVNRAQRAPNEETI